MAEPTTAPATRPLKAVAYVRVSTDRQSEEGLGLTIQREAVRRCAKLAGHRLVAVHADEGVSGALPAAARPGLAAALDMIRTGAAEALVLPKLDRLARTLSVQEAALASVWAQGGRVFLPESEVLRDDPDDPMRTAMRSDDGRLLAAGAGHDHRPAPGREGGKGRHRRLRLRFTPLWVAGGQDIAERLGSGPRGAGHHPPPPRLAGARRAHAGHGAAPERRGSGDEAADRRPQ